MAICTGVQHVVYMIDHLHVGTDQLELLLHHIQRILYYGATSIATSCPRDLMMNSNESSHMIICARTMMDQMWQHL